MAYTDTQYSDLLRAVNQYGSAYNYGNYSSFVNPYSGAAYSPVDYREIMSRKTAPVDPRWAYKDFDVGTMGRIGTGAMGYTIGTKAAPAISQAAQSIGGFATNPAITKMGGVGLGAAGLIYGATRDMNPYEIGTAEQLGNVVSPALAAASALPMILPNFAGAAALGGVLGVGLGAWLNSRQIKKTNEANIEADIQFQKDRDEYSEDIAKEAEEQREQFALGTEADLWGQEASKYSNQYGAYVNPYGQSVFNKGGKLTSKEKSKLKKLGRKGDTELVHVNPKEKAMLEAMGGSGTTNPYTGLLEYHMKGFGHSLSHLAELAVSPALFLGDVFGGTEDPLGRQLDRMTLGYTSVGEPTGTAVFNEETGAWERETSDPNVTIGFDPTGEKIGSAGLYGETPTGTGATTGQAVSGTGWGHNTPAYEGASPRNPVQRIKPEDKIKVVNPFKSDFRGPEGDLQTGDAGLENYRWDLANPYIRENVDIFDEGGVVSQPESLPVDSMFNRQLFAESSFNPSAVSSAGALGLSQITEKTFNDMIGWGWVPEGKEFSDLKTDTDLAVNLQEKYMNDLMTREWNQGSEDVVKAKALAAYNMGPTGLVKKLNKLKADGVDIYNNLDWINQLNSETKNYVNKIMLGGNEKFEQDYTKSWKAGGKEYDQGGITNAIAEFTGNELIINNQSAVEAGIKENNPSKAAAPIRLAMKKGFVTPGQETHGGNPMPVDDKGFIYTKGGKLPFRVRKGAGIYDHATDQFKQDMTDEQIMAVAKKNMNKWEKNNMN